MERFDKHFRRLFLEQAKIKLLPAKAGVGAAKTEARVQVHYFDGPHPTRHVARRIFCSSNTDDNMSSYLYIPYHYILLRIFDQAMQRYSYIAVSALLRPPVDGKRSPGFILFPVITL